MSCLLRLVYQHIPRIDLGGVIAHLRDEIQSSTC